MFEIENFALEKANIRLNPWYQSKIQNFFADIIIGNDGGFHILARDKAITLSALKTKSNNIEYPIHSMKIQPSSYDFIKKLFSIIWLAPVEDINDLFQSAKYTLLIKISVKMFFVWHCNWMWCIAKACD